MEKFFKVAGDFEEEKSFSVDNIDQYLSTISSGKEFGYECELGTLCEGGSVILSLDELKEMVEDESYNIINAQSISKDMVVIKYQRYNNAFVRGFK